MEGFTFGLVDNGVLLVGAYLGFDLGERLGTRRCRAWSLELRWVAWCLWPSSRRRRR